MHPISHGISINPSLEDLRTNPKVIHVSGITTTEAHAAIIVKQRTNPNGEDKSIGKGITIIISSIQVVLLPSVGNNSSLSSLSTKK
jgi:hypothetical protein